MKRAPRPLRTVIADDATLAGWQARQAREAELTRALRRHLPRQLGERIEVREIAGGALELVTTAGAIAAAVRQRIPDLAMALQHEGVGCAELKVRVQVAAGTPPTAPRAPAPRVDRAAIAPLATLAGDLPAGPLKTALARFLRRVR